MDLPDSLMTMQTLQAVLDVIANPVLIKDRDHRTVLVNRAACDTFGYSPEAILGLTERDLFPRELAETLCAINDQVFETGRDHYREEKIPGKSREERTIHTHKSLIRLADGTRLLVIQITDITAYRRAESEARFLALHDPLTGLPNRHLLQDRLDQAIARNRREGRNFAFLYLDVDRFKVVNDSCGHQVGDAVLRKVAKRLTRAVRASDSVARLGGDEFAAIIADIQSEQAAIAACERIIESVRVPIHTDGQKIGASISVGLVLSSDRCADADQLHRCADMALYVAKKNGRDRFHIYDLNTDDEWRRHMATEMALRRAIEKMDEFEVHYQPMVGNRDHQVLGMEALVRWNSRELGSVTPAQFIPIAEKTGLIAPLGEWVLKQACTMLAGWDSLAIAVNLSPVQLRDSGFVEGVLEILRATKVEPSRLHFEITESAVLNLDAKTLQALTRLREAGVQLALDDFGTGYSSLAHLQSFKVDRIKIDRSFVRHLGSSADAEAIIRAILSIGEALELTITAEGVETSEQCEFFSSTSCAELQGFFFHRPLPAADAENVLRAHSLRNNGPRVIGARRADELLE